MTQHTAVSLTSLARGAAIERFDDELRRVVENILDYNAGDGAREIVLRVRIKPAQDRATATVHVAASSKLAAPKECITTFYIGRGREGGVAFEYNPEQVPLFLRPGEAGGEAPTEPIVVNP